jgi:two-component system sensor histidine kinase YesM
MISLFSYVYFGIILENRAVADNRIQMQLTMQQIDYILKDIRQYSYNMIVDTDIEKFVNISSFDNAHDKVISTEKIMNRLRMYISLRDYIQSIILKTDNGIYSTDAPFDSYYGAIFKEDWYKKAYDSGNSFSFSIPHTIKGWQSDYEVISFIIHFKSINTKSNVNSELIINVNYDILKNILKNSGSYFNECMLTNRGKVVYLPENSNYEYMHTNELLQVCNDTTNSGKEILKTRDGYYSVVRSGIDKWSFAVFTSQSLLYDKFKNIFTYDFLYIILIFIIIEIIFRPVISNITRPLSKLLTATQEVAQGNFEVNLSIRTGDEIEKLGNRFNDMTVKLQNYIRESIENEKIKHKMEQDLLISQINPHFIYNTLNTVTYLARKKRCEDIENVIGSLIKILQDSLKISKREAFDTVEQEIEIIDQYSLIQTYRYGNMFKIIWDVEEELRTSKIPKSIIQPLVENALFHGILPDENENGIIKIKIFSSEGNIVIQVLDNGVGIDRELLDRLKCNSDAYVLEKTATGRKHIGINNIKERVRNLYGADASVEIESETGEGTCVTIKVKKEN